MVIGTSKRADVHALEPIQIQLPLEGCEFTVPEVARENLIAESRRVICGGGEDHIR